MKLFLDTEFNGFGGKLMSMALVPEDKEFPEFYCEIEMKDQLDPWVKDNVVPHMHLSPVSYRDFQLTLGHYVNYVISIFSMEPTTIVADWPDDIRYFCEAMITGPGERIVLIDPKINFELDLSIKYESLVPHNALHDARGIRDSYIKNTTT
jgi:hypothetical protein